MNDNSHLLQQSLSPLRPGECMCLTWLIEIHDIVLDEAGRYIISKSKRLHSIDHCAFMSRLFRFCIRSALLNISEHLTVSIGYEKNTAFITKRFVLSGYSISDNLNLNLN